MLLDVNFSTLIQRLADTWRVRRSQRKALRQPRQLANVEALESRQLLTTFTVTTLADTVDSQDGVTSLREALDAANATPAADTIEFFINLNGTVSLTQEELLITNPVTIKGNGEANTVIDGSHASRIFNIGYQAGNVTFDGLTLTGGLSNLGGGAVYSQAAGGTLTIANSTVSGNATTGNGASGGAIDMTAFGYLVITHSKVLANSTAGAVAAGGAIYSAKGQVTISDSLVDHNFTAGNDANGGAIFCSFSGLTVQNSTISNNGTAGNYADGGGIKLGSGDMLLLNSTISGNTVSGLYAQGGGITTGSFSAANGQQYFPTIIIEGCTISGNAASGDYGYGGGVFVPEGTLTMKNSTVSGNHSAERGGGLYLGNANVVLANSTVVLNAATNPNAQEAVGGVFVSSGNLAVYNSIVALNTSSFAPDLHLVSGSFTASHSLIGDNTGAPISEAQTPDFNGNLVGTQLLPIDPIIGPLADNGGLTKTHALLDGPAIDRGDNDLADIVGLTTDQTGRSRFNGDCVDMGAFELQSPLVSFATSDVTVSETIGKYLVTVNLSEATVLPVEVSFLTSGKADNPTDYTIVASPIVIPAGQTSGVIQIDVVNSVGFESPEGIILTLDKIFHGKAGANSTTTIIILDSNAAPPIVQLATAAQSDLEDAGTIAVTVNLSYAIPVDVTVPFTVGGSAGNPADYSITASPIVIPAGQTSATILVNVVSDPTVESDEDVIITLNTPINATLGATTVDTVTIVDDDYVPTVAFLTAVHSVDEFTTSTTVTVSLVAPSLHDVTVPFGTSGVAVKSDDYAVVGNGVLLIPAGSFSTTITINLLQDTLIEGNETFTITLGTPTNATLGAITSNVVTIIDDDVNNAPMIPAGQVFSVAENSGPSTIVGTVSASDSDNPAPYNTLSFSLSSNPGGAFTIDPQSGQITVADQIALNYEVTQQLVVGVTVTDGGSPPLLTTQNITINLDDINEPPTVASTASPNVAENTTFVVTVAGHDVDFAGASVTYSISGGADFSKFTIDPTTGVLAFLQAPNFESPTDSGGNNVYQVTVKVTENNVAGLYMTQDLFVTVTNANEQAFFLSPTAANIPENSTAVMTVSASDPDTLQTLAYSLAGGADQAKFTINPTTGALAFSTAPNFEIPTDTDTNNIYLVTVKVTDNGSPNLFNTRDVQVTVTNVNDAPSIPSGGAVSIPENTTAVMTVAATDADVGQTRTFSISGGLDAALFTIDPATGALAFLSVRNFEAPADAGADNVYNVTVKATDNGSPSLFTTKAIAVTVTNVNELPDFTSSNAASIAENTTAVMTVAATDPDAGQTRTFSISGGTDAGLFTINPTTGVLAFQTPRNFESPADADLDNVYQVTVKATDNGSPSLFTTQDIAVTVTHVNETPSITSGNLASIPENSTAVTNVTATDPDAGQSLIFSIAGGADSALFAIDSATGALSFVVPPNFEIPSDADADNVYQVTVQATDNGSPSQFITQNIAVTVTNGTDNSVLSGGSGSVTFLKKHPAVALMPGITIFAPEGSTSLGQVVVSYFIPKGGLLSDVTFTAAGLGTIVESGPTTFKKAGGTHTLTITLNPGVTAASVEAFLKNFHFSSKKMDTAKHPLGRKIEVQVFDHQGTASNKLVTQILAKAK